MKKVISLLSTLILLSSCAEDGARGPAGASRTKGTTGYRLDFSFPSSTVYNELCYKLTVHVENTSNVAQNVTQPIALELYDDGSGDFYSLKSDCNSNPIQYTVIPASKSSTTVYYKTRYNLPGQTSASLFVADILGFYDFYSKDVDFTYKETAGQVDQVFRSTGLTLTSIKAMVQQSDGKVLLAGTSNNDFAVIRYNADGTLDTSFDSDGRVTTDIGSSTTDAANAIALQSDGKILVAGTSNNDFAVVRYNSNGSLDTAFDTDGKLTTDIGSSTTDAANAIAIQSNGRIVVAGTSNNDFALARYTTAGALDTTFDTNGKVTTDIGSSSTDVGNAITLQSDDKILVAGTSASNFAVARYTTTGALDTTFDTDGKVTTDIGSSTTDAGNSIALQNDGKILVLGTSANDFALARYTTAGALDTTFDTDGKLTQDVNSAVDSGSSVIFLDTGLIGVGELSGSDSVFARIWP